METNNYQDVIQEIDRYYRSSFVIDPEKCMPMVMDLLYRIEQLSHGFSQIELARLNRILSEMMTAMENKDYVRLRDGFIYELKPFLNTISE